MNSSDDSADDFESADEDFDVNETIGSSDNKTQNIEGTKIECCDANSENSLKQLDELKLEETETQLPNSKAVLTPNDQLSETDIRVNDPVHLVENKVVKPNNSNRSDATAVLDNQSKKISEPNLIVEQAQYEGWDVDEDLGNKSENVNISSTQIKVENEDTTSLNKPTTNASSNLESNSNVEGMESGDGWDVEEELGEIDDGPGTPVTESMNVSPSIHPPIDTLPNDRNRSDTRESTDGWDLKELENEASSVVETSKSIPKPEVSKQKDGVVNQSKAEEGWGDFEIETEESPGDGWEIEEEDGFEIPVSLAKVSDGSIQSSQEQKTESSHLESTQSWGGWGGWGVSSLLSTATDSVSTFSSHVTSGLSSVLETTVGAPDPETLAATIRSNTEPDQAEPSAPQEDKLASNYAGLGSIVSGVSFLGSTVINRGLDTLETLGKKTMEVLQEGDPGLMKKRAMLFPDQDKPVLSQILREAKEKADQSDKEKEEKAVARKVHFESLFDDYNGMVHLEALEMLSTQCDLKLQTLATNQSGPQLEDLEETLSQVRDLCELSEDDEEAEDLSFEQFAEEITKCLAGLKVGMSASKLIQADREVMRRVSAMSTESAVEVHQTAIAALAEFTAAGMECFHKSAELILAKPIRNTPDEADSFVQLTGHLCARVSAIANECSQLLTKNHPIANSSMITSIFLEASNSSSYIKNACRLLIPILQVGAVCT